jgi:hypothetical protein
MHSLKRQIMITMQYNYFVKPQTAPGDFTDLIPTNWELALLFCDWRKGISNLDCSGLTFLINSRLQAEQVTFQSLRGKMMMKYFCN